MVPGVWCVGLHCGPAFAGVIGSKCPRFCFLGECSISPAVPVQHVDVACSPCCLRCVGSSMKYLPHLGSHQECREAQTQCAAGRCTTSEWHWYTIRRKCACLGCRGFHLNSHAQGSISSGHSYKAPNRLAGDGGVIIKCGNA